MALVASGFGVLLIALVVVLISYVHNPRLSYRKHVKPLPAQTSQQPQ